MKKDIPKTLLLLKGQEILYWTLSRACLVQSIHQILIPVHLSIKQEVQKIVDKVRLASKRTDVDWLVLEGGSERMYSINNCIPYINKESSIVSVHDAVRPFFSEEAFKLCIDNALKFGASILGLPLRETIKKVSQSQQVIETPNRSDYWGIQTPQCFTIKVFKESYLKAFSASYFGTDDASLAEYSGFDVHVTEGNSENIKITYPIDLQLAELLLETV